MDKNEALQVIRSNYPTDRNQLCEALETLIPELKESEDEKIRKELWEYFHNLQLSSDCDFSPSLTIDDILAWLEKQGHAGKKWIYEDVYLKEKDQVFQDGIDEVIENSQKYGLEKRCEKKTIIQ